MKALISFAIIILLTGCGVKGPLYQTKMLVTNHKINVCHIEDLNEFFNV